MTNCCRVARTDAVSTATALTPIARPVVSGDNRLYRLFRFVGIGGISTALYTVIFIGLMETVKPSVLWATVIAYCCGMVWSFLGHKYVTFGVGRDTRGQIFRYILTYSVGLVLSYAIMDFCVQRYHYLVGTI